MENYERAEQDYLAGMKYKDIAEKYDTSINTVKSWKQRYGWNRNKKSMHTKSEKVCTQNKQGASAHADQIDDGTRETLQNDDLTPKQQMFCIYYNRTFNATQSYLKACGGRYETAMVEGCKLLRNPKIKKELDRLKEIKRQRIVASPDDVVELQMRIAFSDIGDAMSFGRTEVETKKGDTIEVNTVKLNESNNIDTQLIASIKEGRDGISIKMKDSQKALDWLTKYFEMDPMNIHKKEFEKRKLELEILRMEAQTKEAGTAETVKDNFLDALNSAAKEVWEDGNVE